MTQYFTKPEVVAECLSRVREHRLHPNFAGYLCLKRTSARDRMERDLRVDFKEFFDSFLSVPDAPPTRPYVMPFCDNAPSDANKWFNKNVAGSYAPSSIRADKPFAKVVKAESRIVKTETREAKKSFYSLNERHWELAYTYLGFGKKIPIVPLSVFLYRDFAIETATPTTHDLVEIFRDEFGYTSASSQQADTEFQYLYFDDSDSESHPEWFEASL